MIIISKKLLLWAIPLLFLNQAWAWEKEAPAFFFKKPISELILTGNLQTADWEEIKKLELETQSGQKSNPDRLERDLGKIYSLGWIRNIQTLFEFDGDQRRIQILIQPHPVIQQISFLNFKSLETDPLVKKMKNRIGQRINYLTLGQDILMIQAQLLDEGYDLSNVQEVTFQESTQTLQIHMQEPRIRKFIFRGNTQTPSEYLMRSFWAREGDLYNGQRLRLDRFSLLRSGYVSSVSDRIVLQTDDPQWVDIAYEVVEQKKSSVQLGLGYTDKNNKRFIFSSFNLLNYLGKGENIQLRFQYGLETVSTGQDFQSYTYRIRYGDALVPEWKLSWAVENFSETGPENLSVQGVVQSDTDRNVDIRRSGWQTELSLPLSERTIWTGSVRWMQIVENAVDETSAKVNYEKNSFINIFRFEDVKRDIFQNPFQGLSGSLKTENSFASLWADSSLPIQKYDLQSTFYNPFFENKHVLVLNSALGFIYLPANIKVAEGELYRMGGQNTVRGYLSQLPFAVGTKKVQFNIEWRYLFSDFLTLALFYDYGGAFDSDLVQNINQILSQNFAYGYGIGFHFNTPVGTAVFDFAANKADQSFIHFSLGANF